MSSSQSNNRFRSRARRVWRDPSERTEGVALLGLTMEIDLPGRVEWHDPVVNAVRVTVEDAFPWSTTLSIPAPRRASPRTSNRVSSRDDSFGRLPYFPGQVSLSMLDQLAGDHEDGVFAVRLTGPLGSSSLSWWRSCNCCASKPPLSGKASLLSASQPSSPAEFCYSAILSPCVRDCSSILSSSVGICSQPLYSSRGICSASRRVHHHSRRKCRILST